MLQLCDGLCCFRPVLPILLSGQKVGMRSVTWMSAWRSSTNVLRRSPDSRLSSTSRILAQRNGYGGFDNV